MRPVHFAGSFIVSFCFFALALALALAVHSAEPDEFDLKRYSTPHQGEAKTVLDGFIDKTNLSERELSQRGDAYFFLGRFKESASDYNAMSELNPSLEDSHWRRGIAWYYAGDFKNAAGQFERYHSFDNVDRENGIWRYFSQVRAYGDKRAQEDLLKYEKDDRAPFPLLYQFFAGKVTSEEILNNINKADISDEERSKQLFYAELYIGLNHAVHEEPKQAIPHLQQAVANKWGPISGYGPHYMWQVGRVQLERLMTEANAE
ncbi:Lipoprotein NlpI precursor [Polystyrenella longa]|uniref:Lipoprotein NlpI n=1 Tax=Polystyrenella longa TaxID=2528007 RepID=A0A518CPU7_9PLAN|nr:hypothetical protein [Polystyrenella longa]QDU81257.1 Lipoprotein NlpI precursor [Polystyrenella longa]